MKKLNLPSRTRENIEDTLNSISGAKKHSYVWLVLLLLIYAITTIYVSRTSVSNDVWLVHGQPIPVRSFTGALSSIANLCLIFTALFYGKPGFIISMGILIFQFPRILVAIISAHVFTSIAGLFSNIVIILAVCLLYRNTTKAEKYRLRLRNQAITDRLTGLPNRVACSELMGTLIERNEKFAVAVLNLNNFKKINNTMGQHTGNAILMEIADRWKKVADGGLTGTSDFITCQGGDEFSLIIRKYDSQADILHTLDIYQKRVEEIITVDNCDYFISARVGYAEYPADADNSDTLLACAQTALYQAKLVNTSNLICHYTADMSNAEQDIETERIIRASLKDGSLFFCLQPQYDINHKLRGFEVLARIRNADGSIVSPATFIPVAENVGLIDRVDYTVFRDSSKFFGDLIRRTQANLMLSINVSVRHLMKNDFLNEVRDILNTSGIPASQLEIEITESIMIDSIEKALECINEIKRMGIKVAIDDFGTGYSSLSYLNSFPADLLKVDKSFIDKMNTSDSSKQYVAAIISIGHVMNFDVIAEGVEEPDQLETLRNIGCDYIQGYYWGRPLLPDAAEQLVLASVGQADS